MVVVKAARPKVQSLEEMAGSEIRSGRKERVRVVAASTLGQARLA